MAQVPSPAIARIHDSTAVICNATCLTAPLLAEAGIDVPDVATMQRALNRAMERYNMSLSLPPARPANKPPSSCGPPPRPSLTAIPGSLRQS